MSETQRRPTLAQLDALRTVIQTNGVGEAARVMGISQPAVSRLLREAEKGLGLSLMVRDGNRVVATSEAEAILERIGALFGAYDALQRLASSMRADEAGQVSVAAVALQATRLLPPAIHRFKAEFPSTMVKLHVLPTRAVISEVTSGQADFGLVHSFTHAPELQMEDLGEQVVVCIAPSGHRYKRLKVVCANDMVGENLVSYARYSTFARWVEKACEQSDVDIPIAIEVSSSQAMIELVRVGSGIGLLEGAALDPAICRELVIRPFSPELKFTSRIVRPFGRPLSRRAERLLDIYRDVVGSTAN